MNRIKNEPENIIPVPKEFYCEEHNAPFTHCKLCNKHLIENNLDYVIEKAYSQDVKTGKRTLVFELAYCTECMQSVQGELSQESMQNLAKFFGERTQLEQRNDELTKHKLFDTEIWLNNCIVNQSDISEIDEFQITCLCRGDKMMFHHTPYMISGKALDEITMLLSDETLDILNDMWDDLIDLPQDALDIFKRRPVFL